MGPSSDFALGAAGIPSASPLGTLGYTLSSAKESGNSDTVTIPIDGDLLLLSLVIAINAVIVVTTIRVIIERIKRRR